MCQRSRWDTLQSDVNYRLVEEHLNNILLMVLIQDVSTVPLGHPIQSGMIYRIVEEHLNNILPMVLIQDVSTVPLGHPIQSGVNYR